MQQKTVLFGLNKSIDAQVAALLLKKQGYRVICLGVLTGESSTSEQAGHATPRCFDFPLDWANKFCQKYDLEFYASDARELFVDQVLDKFVDARIQGFHSSSCDNCHQMRFKILYDRMHKLGADFMATAHYAKVHHSKDVDEYQLFRSSDATNDQSHFLVGLNQQQLAKLLLPLGDVSRESVFKMAVSLGLELDGKTAQRKKFEYCLEKKMDVTDFIESKVASDIFFRGDILNTDIQKILREHQGLHHFWGGQKFVFQQGSNESQRNLIVYKTNPSEKNVYVRSNIEGINSYRVRSFEFMPSLSRKHPIECYVKRSEDHQLFKILLYFKNNHHVIFETNQELELFCQGMRVQFFNKESGLSRVIGHGVIDDVGPFRPIKRIKDFEDEVEDADSFKFDDMGF